MYDVGIIYEIKCKLIFVRCANRLGTPEVPLRWPLKVP